QYKIIRETQPMARGGINKALVEQARQNLLSRGENPSIDAIRVELGNTGSKTTIHRYLKELEAAEVTRLDDEALLSQPIKELIGRLAATLTEEARSIVKDNEQSCQERVNNVLEELRCAKEENAQLSEQLTFANNQVQTLADTLEAAKSSNNQLEKQANEHIVELSSLNASLNEKQQHIESLEEKHQHSREALQHYRDSVKEQREQDIRQHEQQVQSLQVEIRNLNQTLSIKQTDITQLNKDNARLVSELSQLRKQGNEQDSLLTQLNTELQELKSKNSRLTTVTEDHHIIKRQLTQTDKQVHDLTIANAKLESEIQVKSDMLKQLIKAKQEVTPERESFREN
ncbi:MAG: DNA-binding protein, partial [Pseudomonadota bacterium]